MYIRDEEADAIVAKHSEIQAAVQGKTIMLWLPGQGAGVSVNMCLTFGWMGTLISIYRMVPEIRQAMGLYAVLIIGIMSVMGVIWYAILRGHPTGRTRMRGFSLTSMAVAALTTAIALLRSELVAAALGAAGAAFVAVAQWLVSGPSYALFTAFYRAKRAFGERSEAGR